MLHSGCSNLDLEERFRKEGSFFSTPSPAFIVCILFDDGHADSCEVISHCSFDLFFLIVMYVQGAAAAWARRAERSYSMFKVRKGGCEEIPLIQSKEQRLRFAGDTQRPR